MAKKRHTAKQVRVGGEPAAVMSFAGMQLSSIALDLFWHRIS